VRDIELVANACLEWATFKIRKTALGKMRHTQARNIPENMLLHKIKNIKVPVLTIHTEIDLATDYTNCVFIARFEATFTTAGGVNLPKICKCVGEDGVAYKQMVSVPFVSIGLRLSTFRFSSKVKATTTCGKMP
jgi:ataxia telangiectasia mutated family protein